MEAFFLSINSTERKKIVFPKTNATFNKLCRGEGAAQETTLHESKDLSALYTSLCCVGVC